MTAIETERPILTYQDLLDTDSRPAPAVLRRTNPIELSGTYVPVERYTDRHIHELEIERIWKKSWLMACREEDIPEVGDLITFDITRFSILVVRSGRDTIKAFHNICLHRGRRLKDGCGRSQLLRCAFHGFAWQLDGSLAEVPCSWDFPHVTAEEFDLAEVKVDRWGGFVFVNMDPEAGPLAKHLGELPQHFERWPLEQRYKQAHVAKVLRCNWKLAQEAFMEAYHVVATHPQLLPSIGDANSQYDVFGNVSRAITANATPSPHIRWVPTEQEMADAMTDRNLDEPVAVAVPEGTTARQHIGHLRREGLRPLLGDAADELTDAEMLDSIYYTVFPNFHPWGAYNRICYRFRPYGDDHTRCIMECMYLSPFVGERPPAAPIHWLDEDDDWTDAPELGALARVFNQDVYNLPQVQAGLEAAKGVVPTMTFAQYQETKPRHFHMLWEDWVNR
jgi:phenylpropionate dioxygenase-like ring-hydroxylating dioxygenase large terminal subunit